MVNRMSRSTDMDDFVHMDAGMMNNILYDVHLFVYVDIGAVV